MAKNKNQVKDGEIDFSKVGKVVEAREIKRYTSGGRWNRERILEFLKWCEKNLNGYQIKVLSVDEIFNLFYKPNNERLDDIKKNEERMNSFIRTFVKRANMIAKSEGIAVRTGIYHKVNIKIQKIEK